MENFVILTKVLILGHYHEKYCILTDEGSQ
jgi:hypothetical protein